MASSVVFGHNTASTNTQAVATAATHQQLLEEKLARIAWIHAQHRPQSAPLSVPCACAGLLVAHVVAWSVGVVVGRGTGRGSTLLKGQL